MLIDYKRGRNPANEMALVGMERDLSPADLRAMRTGIGAATNALFAVRLQTAALNWIIVTQMLSAVSR